MPNNSDAIACVAPAAAADPDHDAGARQHQALAQHEADELHGRRAERRAQPSSRVRSVTRPSMTP